MDVVHPVAAALRKARLAHGETLESLSERTGLSLAYLSRIERSRDEPSEKIRIAYAQALGLADVRFSEILSRPQNEYRDLIRRVIRNGIDNFADSIEPSPHRPRTHATSVPLDLSDVDDVRNQVDHLFQFSEATRGVLLLSSSNPLLRDEKRLQVAFDAFLKRSSGRTARLDLILRLSGTDSRAENIPLLAQAIQWSLRYHNLPTIDREHALLAYTLQEDQTIKFPIDIVATDDLGYVVALPTLEKYKPRGGFYLPQFQSDGRKDSIARYLDRVIEEAIPAVRIFGGSAPEEERFVQQELRLNEAWPYFMEHRFFTDLTLPVRQISDSSSSVRRAWSRRLNDDVAASVAEAQRVRIQTFEEKLQSGAAEFRQMCLTASVEHWAKTGLRDDLPYDGHQSPMSQAERIEHIDRILELSQRYSNFKIAMRSDDENDEGEFWAVQGDSRILVGRKPRGERARRLKTNIMSVVIRNRDVANVIAESFLEQWTALPPMNRTKHGVIEFLMRLKGDLAS